MRVFRGASRNLPAVRPICYQISERVRSPSPPRGPRNHSTIAGEAPGGPAAQHRRGTGAGPGPRAQAWGRGGGQAGRQGTATPAGVGGGDGGGAAAAAGAEAAGEDAGVPPVRRRGRAGPPGTGRRGGRGRTRCPPARSRPISPEGPPAPPAQPPAPPRRSPGRPRGVVVVTGRPAGLRRGLDRVRGSRSSAGVHPPRLSTFLLPSLTPRSLRPARAPGADAERARPVLPPPRRRCGCPCSR